MNGQKKLSDNIENLFSDEFTVSEIYDNILENMEGGICIFEISDTLHSLYYNKRFCENIGYTANDCYENNLDMNKIFSPDDTSKIKELALKCSENNGGFMYTAKGYGPDKNIKWYNIKVSSVKYIKSDYPTFTAVLSDITEKRQLEQKLSIIHERYKIFEETTSSVLFDYIVCEDTMKFSSNESGTIKRWDITEYRTSPSLIHPDDQEKFNKTLMNACYSPVKGDIEYRTRAIDPNKYTWCKAYYSSVEDDTGKIIHVFGRMKNIDIEVNKRNAIIRKTERDHLTSIYNRMTAEQKITERINNNYGYNMYFILIDIDNFKNFNDVYGHIFGDKVLVTVSENILKLFPDAISARYGGDEFIIFTDTESNGSVIQKLESLSSDSYCMKNDRKIDITFSIGVAVSDKKIDYVNFFSEADAIMYDVKNNGKNNIIIRNVNTGGKADE